MKNYKFVFGLLFSSVLSYSAHAGTGIPHAEATLPDSASPAAAASEPGGAVKLASLAQARALTTAGTMPVIDLPADYFISRVHLPGTFNYTDGKRDTGQVMLAETKMVAHAAVAEDVTEPASEVLLLAGLSALAIAVRRQSKS
jgi:hypothetical protein